MRRMIAVSSIVALLLAAAVAAQAALCEKCQGKSYIQLVGKCTSCGRLTASKAFKLCATCSKKLKKCEHCLVSLVAESKPSRRASEEKKTEIRMGAPTASQPEAPKIDPKRSGRSQVGLWRYDLEVAGQGTDKELRVGRLFYAEHRAGAAEINDFHDTPWGPMYWVGDPKGYGDHGWMPEPAQTQGRKGKLLPLPGTGPKSLELNEADNDKTVRVVTGTRIFIRLRGNPTTGYRWHVGEVVGRAVGAASEPAYAQDPGRPAAVGAGGTFTFEFRAGEPGKATIKLSYRRPWETGKPPAQSFAVRVEVEPAAPARPAPGKPPA